MDMNKQRKFAEPGFWAELEDSLAKKERERKFKEESLNTINTAPLRDRSKSILESLPGIMSHSKKEYKWWRENLEQLADEFSGAGMGMFPEETVGWFGESDPLSDMSWLHLELWDERARNMMYTAIESWSAAKTQEEKEGWNDIIIDMIKAWKEWKEMPLSKRQKRPFGGGPRVERVEEVTDVNLLGPTSALVYRYKQRKFAQLHPLAAGVRALEETIKSLEHQHLEEPEIRETLEDKGVAPETIDTTYDNRDRQLFKRTKRED